MAIQYYDSPFHATEDFEVASKLALKTDIMIMIRDIIEQQEWAQAEAAERLCVTQPRVSDLVNGKIDKFTLDALFGMLDTLGFRAQFTFGTLNESAICIKRIAA